MSGEIDYTKLRDMIARCHWTFAKTMPWAPHEYIVRGKCALTEDEFLYFVDMQQRFGVHEHWGKYYHPYLYIDDYKYWTMGAPYEETIIINRAKVKQKESFFHHLCPIWPIICYLCAIFAYYFSEMLQITGACTTIWCKERLTLQRKTINEYGRKQHSTWRQTRRRNTRRVLYSILPTWLQMG